MPQVRWTCVFAVRFGLWWTVGWRSCWPFWTLTNLKPHSLCLLWRVWRSSSTWQPSAPLPPGNSQTCVHYSSLSLCFCFTSWHTDIQTFQYFYSFVLFLSLSLVAYSVTFFPGVFLDSPSPLLWVPTETLGRALKSCQSVLEGGPQPISNQNYFLSAVQTTVGILDSILYLTSKDIYSNKNTHYTYCSFYLFAVLFILCHKKGILSVHVAII